MPNGKPINTQHLHAERAIQEVVLTLAHLIALQVMREGSASSMEVSKNAEAHEERG